MQIRCLVLRKIITNLFVFSPSWIGDYRINRGITIMPGLIADITKDRELVGADNNMVPTYKRKKYYMNKNMWGYRSWKVSITSLSGVNGAIRSAQMFSGKAANGRTVSCRLFEWKEAWVDAIFLGENRVGLWSIKCCMLWPLCWLARVRIYRSSNRPSSH